MNANYIVGAILIAFGIAVLSQIGSLTSSQMVDDPFVGTCLFIIGDSALLCRIYIYKSKNLRLDTDSEG